MGLMAPMGPFRQKYPHEFETRSTNLSNKTGMPELILGARMLAVALIDGVLPEVFRVVGELGRVAGAAVVTADFGDAIRALRAAAFGAGEVKARLDVGYRRVHLFVGGAFVFALVAAAAQDPHQSQ